MKWDELATIILENMTEEQRQSDVTAFLPEIDEYSPCVDVCFIEEDEKHPCLKIK